MREISRIREFSGEKSDKSIHEMISEKAIPQKDEILQYLKSFQPDCSAGMLLQDEITGELLKFGVNGFEDGNYYWDSREIYHFEKYNMQLEKEFVEYVLQK